ncbi:hypothetical protein Aduo_010484 [Ancylostoma duodenale]
MEKFKSSLSKTLKDLGSSFSDDVNMEDMSDYVLSPYEGPSSGCTSDAIAGMLEKPVVRTAVAPTPVSDDDIIDSIDACYFIEDDFDAIDYELKKLSGIDLRLEDVVRERMRLKSQLQVVSRKISTLIMEKSPSYGSQLEDLDSIRDSLKELISLISTIRGALAGAKCKSRTALSVLACEKKKRMLKSLIYTLRIIKTLYETEFHLKDSIEDSNFPLAIRICLEAKEAANTYRHFCCVSDLMTKLVGSTSLIESALDNALSAHTVVFDQDRYSSVYSAYIMLNKVELASKKLVGHFVTTLQRSTRKIVEEKCRSYHDKENLAEFSFEQLCERIDGEQIVSTVRELGYVMCKILTIYHTILRYHTEDDEQRRMSNSGEDPMLGVVAHQMTSSLHAVFRVALSKMNSLLCCQDFSALKFDQLLDIVDMTNRFRLFGRNFFGHSSNELILSLEKQTVSYFKRYHSERMEELRMFLENECFTICPVSQQFTIFDLQDFSFLEESRKQKTDLAGSPKDAVAEQNGFVPIPANFINPFATAELESRKQSQRNSRSGDEGEEATMENGSMDKQEEIEATPNLCNTALTLLRFFGRYIRMTSLLPSIADYSVPALTQLFEYFFYSVCIFFGSDGSEQTETPPRIKAILSDIYARLLGDEAESLNGTFDKDWRLGVPKPCSGLDLNHVDKLYGAVERVIAVESVEFVARQLDLVRPVMESLVPPSNESIISQLDQFYAKILSGVPDTRRLVFDCVASRALKLPVLIAAVSNTKWDINELQSHHSSYVDFLVKDFEAFSLRLDHVAECVNLSEAARALLWDRTISYTFKALVQGYCEGGKCSTEGRALMQLDFQHLLLKLEPICNLHPVPHTTFVEGYIKAFYLPENGLEEWISKHSASFL